IRVRVPAFAPMQQRTGMQTNIETLSKLERRLDMAVPAEQIEREGGERLREVSGPGGSERVRPGEGRIRGGRQQDASQVRPEVIGDAVQKAFTDVVREQNLRVAGYPRIERKEGSDGTQLAFSATFEIYPDIKLGDLSAVKLQRPVHPVEDADVDRTIEILRKQRVTWESVARAAQTGDRVTVDFVGRIDGAEFPGGKGSAMAATLRPA